jgi:hypothetical protein
MTDENAGALPPCLPLRLRVGVSGHREAPKLPPEVVPKVRASIDLVLSALLEAARLYASDLAVMYERCGARQSVPAGIETPQCVIISSLAEGADRIVAEAGLSAGFSLESVLPFKKDVYVTDFTTAGSRADFNDLLGRATSVFVLDGDANERPRAYEAAGFVMLANVDVLIAIWDGDEANGIGGTTQIVSRAVADGIPVVWINPTTSHELQLSWPRPDEMPLANASARLRETFRAVDMHSIAEAIMEALSPPPVETEEYGALRTYLRERDHRWNLCPWFPLLLWLFSGRPLRYTDFKLPGILADTRAQWASYFAMVPKDDAQRPIVQSVLLPAFRVADHLAVYYSLVYRSTYVFNFLFAAIAVALALTGIFLDDPRVKVYVVLAELLVIGAILFTWYYGHSLRWHRRWLDYRRLAECLRQMRILGPVGSGGPIDRPGRRLMVDERDWVNWYAWSLRRLLPLPNCVGDDAYVRAIRDATRSIEIAEQLRYHTGNAERMATLDHRMHCSGQWLFGITGGLCLLFCCLFLFAGIPDFNNSHTESVLHAFTFITALLPTLGAALAAVHVQGDFKTVAEQSKRTAMRLEEIDKVLAFEPPLFARLVDRIEKASDVMMADVLEWQTVFRTRPLSLPA